MTYLNFITLNTGSIDRMGPPQDNAAGPAALDLARALRDGRAAIADHPGYDLAATTVGPALLCTTYGRDGLLLTMFGVAARSRGAERLWQTLHEQSPGYGLATDPDTMPATPWCAVRAEPSLMRDLSAAHWLAAYEVEVATAWIERRHRDA